MFPLINTGLLWTLLGCSGPAGTALPAPTDTDVADDETDDTDDDTEETDDTAVPPSEPGTLVISEIMPRNRTGYLDEDGHESDWIELHNLTEETLDLTGIGLGEEDDLWSLPAGELAPGALLVIFASGKDRSGDELHTDFSLSSSGEPLWLVAADGAILDGFDDYPALDPGVSYGRAGVPLVDLEAGYRWRIPTDTTTDWTDPALDDDDWSTGSGALGQGGDGSSDGALAHLTPSVASHWDFNADSGGEVADMVGQHPGTLEDGAALTTGGEGVTGEALSGSSGGWLSAEDPEAYDFDSDHSWSVWFRGTDSSGCLISRNPWGTAWNQGSKALFVRNGTLEYDAGWVGNPSTGVAVTDDAWHHAAVTFRAADDALSIYLDGQLRYAETFNTNAYDESESHNGGEAETGLFVGEANFSGGLSDLGKYDGLIDDVTVFTTALSAEDVALIAAGAAFSGVVFASEIDTEVPAETLRAQLRLPFEVADRNALTSLSLAVRYDDALRVWLNGTLVALLDATEPDAAAAADREDALALTPTVLSISAALLQDGENLLAVEVLAADGESPTAFVDLALSGTTEGLGILAAESPGETNGLFMSEAVVFSEGSGTFEDSLRLTLSTEAGTGTIRYTLDGSEPDEDDAEYTDELELVATTEVRARAWQSERGAGPVGHGIYVAREAGMADTVRDLPVIVLVKSTLTTSWSDGSILIFDADASLRDRPEEAGPAGMHIRGQSSASQDKVPLRIELRDARGHDRDEALLGLPDEADWVLHAPYVDKTLMRNALVFELGRELGLEAPRTAYSHLYILDEDEALSEAHYEGIYVLVESIKVGSSRLDISELEPSVEAGSALSGGYVLKFEASVAEQPILDGWSSLELFEPDAATAVQLDWITTHIQDFDTMLFSGAFADPASGYASWIDEDSWIDQLIINELFRDQDAYVRSAYLHKDRDGLLVMGPLWDYNLAAGTGGYFGNTDIEDWQWQHPYNAGEHGWFERLMSDSDFSAAVASRWQTLRAGVLSDAEMQARIDAHAVVLASGAEDNVQRWDNLEDSSVNGFVSPSTTTWEEQLDVMAQWLADRSAWMDAQLP